MIFVGCFPKHREVYLQGLQAIGLAAPNWGIFRQNSTSRYSFRDFFAVPKALWQVRLTSPKPTCLESAEGIK
ncbi:hypothetical protein [Microcoleus sp. bin38.metabat.b11b12b14.051]|uniref:hypothetical protein n=1 Tax=Microcoleus sp. bin38.metabat.b11b12b14.051 TaxID=2742709 RepID=UPI0025F5B668|nr:hypothetical protein [Microcoleus sp. bin38.metabat.b11b12b14.051]